MAAEARDTVYNKIVRHINRNGGTFSQWYCGITNNPDHTLFVRHNVARNSAYFHKECFTEGSSRDTERRLLARGCDGGGGGGGIRSVHVYVYRITQNTVERQI